MVPPSAVFFSCDGKIRKFLIYYLKLGIGTLFGIFLLYRPGKIAFPLCMGGIFKKMISHFSLYVACLSFNDQICSLSLVDFLLCCSLKGDLH